MTSLGRAAFGFYAETNKNAYFVNDSYIANLCAVENKLAEFYGKIILYGFAFSIFSITTANKALGDSEYLGVTISKIPYLTEFCSLVLGAFIALAVNSALDAHAITRMRMDLFSITGSESPNMRMVHMKGAGAWVDSLLPKRVGYASNFSHRAFQVFGLIWAFMLPFSFLSVLLSAQLVCILSILPPVAFNLSSVMVWVSVTLSSSSILVLVVVALIPLKFTLRRS
jgi:hypothetical protein